jgi:Glycosyl hydrolase 108
MLSNEVMHFEKGGKPMSTSVIPSGAQTLVSFDIAYKQLIERWEDPHYSGKITTDGGGKTRYGLSESAYPSLDISTITAQRAKEITENDYWGSKIWDVPNLIAPYQPLANKLFQFGFNSGIGTVVQLSNLIITVISNAKVLPSLSQHLKVSTLNNIDYNIFLHSLVAAQLSRYIKDYHLLSRVPHSLLDRALCID